MFVRRFIFQSCLLLALLGIASAQAAEEFEQFLKPLFAKSCVKCHGGEKVKGKINLKQITTAQQFLAKPELIQELIEVIDAADMPPEDEPQLTQAQRTKMLATLKAQLRAATVGIKARPVRIRRLNRFQYNNAVRDLFQLNRDVFALPEKLMTRESIYLNAPKMPDRVNVRSLALNPAPGMRAVRAFPKDLRAAHGFDNQANQLTLSPLLLDAFLSLSVSVVESPDFNEQTVGIWKTFFQPPAEGADLPAETRKRIAVFLALAFRGPVESTTIDRYTAYALGKIKQEIPFTAAMKKVASAALSSPLFLYRYQLADAKNSQHALASNLSFFLWVSGPDAELLRLAEAGKLSEPAVLEKTIDRMLADPKIERFLDTFPAQWMQLENVLAATPDPRKHRLFALDKNNPASLQMLMEPLLLFDAVFVEDRPIADLITPKFGYQSDFLKTWYTTDLEPPTVDVREIVEMNRRNAERRNGLEKLIKNTKTDLEAMLKPVRAKLLAERKKNTGGKKPVDLKPYAAWEFNGDLKSSVNSLELKAHGKIQFKDGMVVLNRAYLLSNHLPIDLRAKSLEIWCKVGNVNQRGGGVMGIQGPGDFFDTIVLGERKPRHWISGSNGFSRTLDFPNSTPENAANELLHLVMVYQPDGTTRMYRNGKPYGQPFRRSSATFPKNRSSVIFGLRHLPPGGNKYLNVSIDKARLYNRVLTAAEVAASSTGTHLYISEADALQAMLPAQKKKHMALNDTLKQAEAELKNIPQPRDTGKIQQAARQKFDNEIRNKLRGKTFERLPVVNPRYGGVITSAAMLSMTAGPKRTHPIGRGAWIIEVIFNDPPPPPPNDVPPLNEDALDKNLTIREKFAQHRANPNCAGCHSRLDPLGFALENFDITGRWRDKYPNGRTVDATGTLLRKYKFNDIVDFKKSLVQEDRRFAKAFTAHLLRFALARELTPVDTLAIDRIVNQTENEGFKLKSLIRKVVQAESFLKSN
ncbi:MAG: DUF1588 domain-containing protein [Verrucomicrobia subdivision 3 bacterium]|nr:DUF1588 domain-containing protein [Limisphaerales bacterium]